MDGQATAETVAFWYGCSALVVAVGTFLSVSLGWFGLRGTHDSNGTPDPGAFVFVPLVVGLFWPFVAGVSAVVELIAMATAGGDALHRWAQARRAARAAAPRPPQATILTLLPRRAMAVGKDAQGGR